MPSRPPRPACGRKPQAGGSDSHSLRLVASLPLRWAAAVAVAVVAAAGGANASFGDQSHVFMTCIHNCYFGNCSTDSDMNRFRRSQPWHLRLLGWDCEDECGHQCMWKAVQYFSALNEKVQFHGKWPFVRWMGLQEPASAVFSLFNLIAHSLGWSEFSRRVSPSNRFFMLWKTQAYLAMNAWIWSTIFHARDLPLTEFMDYFGAYSIVLYSLYALVIRVLADKMNQTGMWVVQLPFLTFFIYHLYYMVHVKFDYHYHVMLNITIGILNSFGWLCWVWCNRVERPYSVKCAIVVVLLLALSSLEMFDFSPVWFTFDAHSLWHLGTAPLPFIWYRFLVDDCRFESIRARTESSSTPLHSSGAYRKSAFARYGFLQLKCILKDLTILHPNNEEMSALE